MKRSRLQLDLVLAAARDAIRPRLLQTAIVALLGAVFLAAAVLHADGLLGRMLGGIALACWLLFGLTALALQIQPVTEGGSPISTGQAFRLAARRIRSIVMLPIWAIALVLGAVACELLLLWLANLPGLGLVWLAVIVVPLMLINTVLAAFALLVWFNLAATIAMADEHATAEQLRATIQTTLRTRLGELLVTNIGGILIASMATAVVFLPLSLGMQTTVALAETAAPGLLDAILAPTGFWSGMAYMTVLLFGGLLGAGIAGVPLIVIVHVTLAIHRSLAEGTVEGGSDEHSRG